MSRSHKLSDISTLIVKKGPYNKPIYLAKPSFAKGIVPNHLTTHTGPFTEQAKRCSQLTKGMPMGKNHVLAMRQCIGSALIKAGGKKARMKESQRGKKG